MQNQSLMFLIQRFLYAVIRCTLFINPDILQSDTEYIDVETVLSDNEFK